MRGQRSCSARLLAGADLAAALLCLIVLQLCCSSLIAQDASLALAPDGLLDDEYSDRTTITVKSCQNLMNTSMAGMKANMSSLQAAQKRADNIMRRAGEVLSRSALLPGMPPINCTCEQYNAMLCFAPGCFPCDRKCFQGSMAFLASSPGPLGSGPFCARGCTPCCNTVAAVPDTNCTLPVGGCPE